LPTASNRPATSVRVAGAASVFALLLLGAAPVRAASPPPPPLPGNAAVDQYREGIPAGGGPVAPGATGGRSKPLPKSVQQRLERVAGANGALLSKIATSPDYGAPAASDGGAKGPEASPGSGPKGRPSGARGGQAAGAPAAESGRGTRLWPAAFLVVALLAVSALAAAVAMRRRRRPA
jgi:hypothetical protein